MHVVYRQVCASRQMFAVRRRHALPQRHRDGHVLAHVLANTEPVTLAVVEQALQVANDVVAHASDYRFAFAGANECQAVARTGAAYVVTYPVPYAGVKRS